MDAEHIDHERFHGSGPWAELRTEAFRSSADMAIYAALERYFKGVSDEIKQLFDAWIPELRSDTFVTCVGTHR